MPVAYSDLSDALTRQEQSLLLLLADEARDWVSAGLVRRQLFGGACSRSAVRQLVFRLRRKLAGTVYVIETDPDGRAYRLVEREAA